MTLYEILEKYIDGTYKTLKEAAESNGFKEDKLKNFVRKISKSINKADLELCKKYVIVASQRQKEARIKGGKNGKATSSYKQDDFDKWYSLIVDKNLTLVNVEKVTGVPKSVIYENLNKNLPLEKKEKLREVYLKHKYEPSNAHQNDVEFFPEKLSKETLISSIGRGKR